MKDLKGKVFERLTVVEFSGRSKHHHPLWLCKCSCGQEKIINAYSLIKGSTRSCGCLDREKRITSPNRTTHGMHGTRLYRIWKAMKTRCYNPNDKYFDIYGGRDIVVCEEWKNDFSNFYEWSVANGYTDELTIDRINTDGNYEPSNCRWATLIQQASNRRDNHFVTINGESKTITAWCREYGMSRSTFYKRLKEGKTGIELLSIRED